MAAEDGAGSRTKRGERLPIVLGLAVLACALAFAWVAFKPTSQRTRVAGQPVESAVRPRPAEIAASGAEAVGGSANRRVTITVMTLGNELRPDQIAAFEAENPDIRILFIEFGSSLLDILLATNDPPDVFRLGQVEHEPLVRRGLLLDVTDRIAASKVISLGDMRESSTAEVAVGGRYYGLPQGLSTPDFASLYINTAAFRAAGLPLPSPVEPLTYAELAGLAKTLTAKTGRPAFYSFFFERNVSAALAQTGGRMFADDFSEMTLTGNPKALDVMRYFYDLAVSGAMHVPPATPGIAFMFENGELPMSQSGYWMGAVITPATPAHGRVTMLPPPVWSRQLPRVASYLGGTKLVIASASKHPDQAYRFIEWYAAGEPAIERVRKGWGFPLLRSMESLLPRETEFDKQRLRVAQDALKLPVASLPAYPYRSILPAFNQSWTRNIALAKSGKIDFAAFASNLQEDVNLAIRDDVATRDAEQPR